MAKQQRPWCRVEALPVGRWKRCARAPSSQIFAEKLERALSTKPRAFWMSSPRTLNSKPISRLTRAWLPAAQPSRTMTPIPAARPSARATWWVKMLPLRATSAPCLPNNSRNVRNHDRYCGAQSAKTSAEIVFGNGGYPPPRPQRETLPYWKCMIKPRAI